MWGVYVSSQSIDFNKEKVLNTWMKFKKQVFVFYHGNCTHFLLVDSVLKEENTSKSLLILEVNIVQFLFYRQKKVRHEEAKWLAQDHFGKTKISNQMTSVKNTVDFCPEVILLKDGGY